MSRTVENGGEVNLPIYLLTTQHQYTTIYLPLFDKRALRFIIHIEIIAVKVFNSVNFVCLITNKCAPKS